MVLKELFFESLFERDDLSLVSNLMSQGTTIFRRVNGEKRE